MENQYIVKFRNRNQVILFECELKGQISDGQWENTMPYRHYEKPCNTIAEVSNDGKLGLNYRPVIFYGFSSPSLFNVVKHRMMFYVKFYNVFPNISIGEHHYTIDHLSDLENDHISFDKINQGVQSNNEYYIERLSKIESLLNVKTPKEKQEICKKIAEYNYTEKDCKMDLRDMSKIWKMGI